MTVLFHNARQSVKISIALSAISILNILDVCDLLTDGILILETPLDARNKTSRIQKRTSKKKLKLRV